MIQLITDRTQQDVLSGNAKGIYSDQDLNRVELAVQQLCALAAKMDILPGLVIKTDWGLPGCYSADEWPVESQMVRYLQNVKTLVQAVGADAPLPDSMNALDFSGANSIEAALQSVYERIMAVIAYYSFSGELFAGEE